MSRCSLCFRDRGTASLCPHCGLAVAQGSGPLVLPPGTLLAGQYRVGQVLGQPGGFGITYLAWDERLEMRVAIKEFFPRELAGRGTDRATLQPHTQSDGSLFAYGLQQFLQEARTLARFDHPNIVRVRNFFEENGTGYLVMDYYEGQSLAAYLAQQPGERLEEDLAVKILLHVLDGLRAVHAEGLLHRDIDPHNVYLTAQGRVILLDFGAARVAVGEKSRSLSVILKPGYAPYEQYATSGKQGPWTDVYACAATLYRMVTGRTATDAPSRILEDTLRPAHELNPEVSRRLGEVLQRALALRPQARPQGAEEFQKLLLAERLPAPPPPGPHGETPPEEPRKPPKPKLSRTGVVAAVCIVALLLLAGAFLTFRPSPEQRELTASVAMLSPAVRAHLDDSGYRPARRLLHEDFSQDRTDWIDPRTLEPVDADSVGITVRNGRLYIGTPMAHPDAWFEVFWGFAGIPIPHGDVVLRLHLRLESGAGKFHVAGVGLRINRPGTEMEPDSLSGMAAILFEGGPYYALYAAGTSEENHDANSIIHEGSNTLELVAVNRELSLFINGRYVKSLSGMENARGRAIAIMVSGDENTEYSFADLVMVALEEQ
jgi:serine/threonine protein kinase